MVSGSQVGKIKKVKRLWLSCTGQWAATMCGGGLMPLCQLRFTHSRPSCKGTIHAVGALSDGMPCTPADVCSLEKIKVQRNVSKCQKLLRAQAEVIERRQRCGRSKFQCAMKEKKKSRQQALIDLV